MKNLMIVFLAFGFSAITIACGAPSFNSTESTAPPSHSQWSELLGEFVDSKGLVDYEGIMKVQDKLDAYLNTLEASPPSDSWSEKEKIAYWINAYNAYTVKLIINNYPVEGIKEIKKGIPFVNTVWDIKFIEIGGKKLDLNNIEHGILRKDFDEPRVHFALVCAAQSCPRLRNEAYTAEKLDDQLDDEGFYFIQKSGKNEIMSENSAKLSSLLNWYGGDFDSMGGVIEMVNKYSDIKLNKDATIEYLPYDWSLNKQ